jgi:predicted transcriptional regulator
VMGAMVKDFVNRVFDGAAQPLLLHLATSETLSATERSELRKLIERTPAAGGRKGPAGEEA